ncbi:MAG: hypothetical protein EAX81_00240 [Candidatus Thorarchaeota archaeon]|nr:hypothetical protein [Candidatus Thorarchaeota archaeon]
MSSQAEANQESTWRWCEGIPPLDPVDPRHSLSLLLVAEAREGQRSPKKSIDSTLPKQEEEKKHLDN